MGSKRAGARRARAGRANPPARHGEDHPGADAPAAAGRRSPDPLSLLLDILVLGLATFYLVSLWRQASTAAFASDECFHAYLSEWIARRGRLPHELPEFYSGLPYFYPPLFHLVGAFAFKIAGIASLKYLNVVLTGGLFATLYALPVPRLPRAARRCAILLCLASPALSLYAVRLYAETLATLLAVLVVMLLLRARARPGVRAGILLGVAVGAALLAKQSAVVLPILLVALAALDRARGRGPLAATMLVALVAGMVLALPFFVRNAVLFGGPFYPPTTSNAGVTLDALNTRLFTLPVPMFYRSALIAIGPIVPWLASAALAWNLTRGRFNLATGLLAACLAFILLAPFVPRFPPRLLNPFTAMMALLGSLVLVDALGRQRRAALAAQAILVVWSAVFVIRLTGLRSDFDASPADRKAYRAIAAYVPPGGNVLSRTTYDTFYYARRRATWPIPWGGSAGQLELFTEQDPDRFLAALDRLGIDHLLVPRRTTARRFNGANFPESFVDCVAALVERGRLRVLWGSADLVLVGKGE